MERADEAAETQLPYGVRWRGNSLLFEHSRGRFSLILLPIFFLLPIASLLLVPELLHPSDRPRLIFIRAFILIMFTLTLIGYTLRRIRNPAFELDSDGMRYLPSGLLSARQCVSFDEISHWRSPADAPGGYLARGGTAGDLPIDRLDPSAALLLRSLLQLRLGPQSPWSAELSRAEHASSTHATPPLVYTAALLICAGSLWLVYRAEFGGLSKSEFLAQHHIHAGLSVLVPDVSSYLPPIDGHWIQGKIPERLKAIRVGRDREAILQVMSSAGIRHLEIETGATPDDAGRTTLDVGNLSTSVRSALDRSARWRFVYYARQKLSRYDHWTRFYRFELRFADRHLASLVVERWHENLDWRGRPSFVADHLPHPQSSRP